MDGWGKGDKYVRQNNKVDPHDLVYHVNLDDVDNDEEYYIELPDPNPKRQAMSRGRGDKVLNENLNPLYRFLDSQVGRPWDKVYSEIKENIKFESATQLHILQHLKSHVAGSSGENDSFLFEKDGRIYSYGPYSVFRDVEIAKNQLFVHPRTKLLCRYNKDKKAFPPLTESDVKKISERIYYCKIGGIWYEVTYDEKHFRAMSSKDKKPEYPFEAYFRNRKVIGHPKNVKMFHCQANLGLRVSDARKLFEDADGNCTFFEKRMRITW